MKMIRRSQRPERMAARAMRCLSFLFLALMVAGCPSNNKPAAAASGKVLVKGSNTIGEELAPHLIAEFQKQNPQINVSLESKGTASGFTGLLDGQCDIAGASRVVSSDELDQAHKKGIEFNVHTIGHYSVAVVVNDHNSVKNLSRDQVRDIFTGVATNWNQVGGPDASIHCYIRDPVSGTYLGFRELAMEDKAYGTPAKTFTNYSGIADAVAHDANGIGYASFDLTGKAGVKPITIRGISPDPVSVNEGQYPYSRVLRFYTNRTNESLATLEFIQFVQSAKGQQILEQYGFVPRL